MPYCACPLMISGTSEVLLKSYVDIQKAVRNVCTFKLRLFCIYRNTEGKQPLKEAFRAFSSTFAAVGASGDVYRFDEISACPIFSTSGAFSRTSGVQPYTFQFSDGIDIRQ